jgi:hypothetical protein
MYEVSDSGADISQIYTQQEKLAHLQALSARTLQHLIINLKIPTGFLRTMSRKKTDKSGTIKPRDGSIDIDLDNSSTCLCSVAMVAHLVGESGEDVVFRSYYDQDSEVYIVNFKDLDEYKRMVISACVEGQIADQELECVKFRIKTKMH